ncbi:GreA/GreB family elongation factor [Olivibacter sp. SDN3]|uniref:GreA/GreB family elongation factor n=1 Tax=Olivibacter sp. SDN3 TaxID=2764720 RepID=UPI0016516608|nr:GreA/GreB family elongation factor [Olivibacter sp. SDN3]QNL49969.1 GreA/GreB family elongation factor [Olivibacter sp. SDN3]
MNNLKNQVVLSQEDYNLLTKHVKPTENNDNTMSLAYELGRAKILPQAEIPKDRVKINSVVEIKDLDTNIKTVLTIVPPEQADIKQQKISVLTPIGSALIGFKENDQVEWKMPAGLKKYKIIKVN